MRTHFGYSMSVVREALAMYRAGKSAKQIGAEFAKRLSPSPSYATIGLWVKAAGLTRSLSRAQQIASIRRLGKDYDGIRAEARRLVVEESFTPAAAARRLGVDDRVVHDAIPTDLRPADLSESLSRALWQSNTPEVDARRRRRDEVIALRERGVKVRDIGPAVGVSATTVVNYLRAAGMTKAIARRKVAA